jgi:hypothetical protein
MNPAGPFDWAWWIGGAVLAAAGIAVGAWALLWDRVRGGRRRPRCPGCWYDMSGSAGQADGGAVCPECGRRVRHVRQLHRSRRRWRWAVAGAVAAVAGYAAWCVPRVRDEGWQWGFAPTTVLIAATWNHDPTPHEGFRSHWDKTPIPLRHRAWQRLDRRHGSGWMWDLHHRLWVHRWILPRLLLTPESWPAGHPMVVRVPWESGGFGPLGYVFKITPRFEGAVPVAEYPSALTLRLPFEGRELKSGNLRSTFHEVGVPPAGLRKITYDIELFSVNATGDGWVRRWRTSTTRPITIVASPADARPAVRGPEADAAVRSFYGWGVNPAERRWWFSVRDHDDVPEPLRGTTLGYRIEVLYHDEVVASGRWWCSAHFKPSPASWGSWRLEGDLERLKGADPADPAWRVRLTGDPLMALRDFKGKRWWDGVIERPLGGKH